MCKKIRIILIAAFSLILISGCAKRGAKTEEASQAPEMEQKILSFNLSNYADDGSKKWVLKGDSADILAEIVYLTNIHIDSYEEPKLILTSDTGSYDRKSRTIIFNENVVLDTSDGFNLVTDEIEWDGITDVISTDCPVEIKRSDVLAFGLGAKALPEMKKIILHKDVEVIILRDIMGGDSIAGSEERPDKEEQSKAIITCDGPFEIDYENDIAIFRNNVKVDDSRGQIYSDIMEAYLEPESKNITKVMAQGGVRVVRDKDSTFSERALYTTADQRIILLGSPEIRIHADEEIEKMERGFGKTKR